MTYLLLGLGLLFAVYILWFAWGLSRYCRAYSEPEPLATRCALYAGFLSVPYLLIALAVGCALAYEQYRQQKHEQAVPGHNDGFLSI